MARNGVLPALIALAQSKDHEREIHACACMANLAEMVEGRTQRRMLEEGCLRPLLNLATSPHAEVVREVARALALFASKRDSQASVLPGWRAANGRVRWLEGIASRRRRRARDCESAVVTQNHQEPSDTGAVAALLPLASSEDLETRRCVAFALNNIASNELNHRVCERMGVLRPLVRLLKDKDQDTHLQACFAVASSR